MSEIVISIEDLSKAYQLGKIGTGTLHNDLKVWWAQARGKPNPLLSIGLQDSGNRKGETVWALRNINLAVNKGEVLGVIGRNGAGKSTLLKILASVTAPTSGHVKLKGTIASLLEVGTGFHPDLTGRENIYLNGAILGMRKAEITRKFEEITEFAEIPQFIDTPVKRYSTGMYVRLAFAVAAHLEPDILLVDEVLAVGDAGFQAKCLGKMGDVANLGRTILFVSHNMGAIKKLCGQAIRIHQGQLIAAGDSQTIVDQYLTDLGTDWGSSEIELENHQNRNGTGEAKINKITVVDHKGIKNSIINIGKPFRLIIEVGFNSEVLKMFFGIGLANQDKIQILNLRSDGQHIFFGPFKKGTKKTFIVDVPGLPLYPGIYFVEPWIGEYGGIRTYDRVHDAMQIVMESTGHYESESIGTKGKALMFVDCAWKEGSSE
jgi:lipopolysaccharide transport system ATP-binding protein